MYHSKNKQKKFFFQTVSEEEGYSDDVDKYDDYRNYDNDTETDDYDYDDYDDVTDDFVDRNNVDKQRRSVTSPRRDFRAKLSSGGYPNNQVFILFRSIQAPL